MKSPFSDHFIPNFRKCSEISTTICHKVPTWQMHSRPCCTASAGRRLESTAPAWRARPSPSACAWRIVAQRGNIRICLQWMNLYCSCIICVYKYLIYMWLHLYHLYMHIYVCIWMCIYVIYTYICNIWKMHTYSHFFNVHIRQTNPATIQQLTSWDRSIQFKSNETKSKST